MQGQTATPYPDSTPWTEHARETAQELIRGVEVESNCANSFSERFAVDCQASPETNQVAIFRYIPRRLAGVAEMDADAYHRYGRAVCEELRAQGVPLGRDIYNTCQASYRYYCARARRLAEPSAGDSGKGGRENLPLPIDSHASSVRHPEEFYIA
jgi:hypothetical protein